jgi:L-threonylcarbamoyladenylate synthase
VDPERANLTPPEILSGDAVEAIARAALVLCAGGLVAFPTETVYGLGGRALDPAAIARIFAAKGRPATHPLIAHVLGEAEGRSLAARWPEVATVLAAHFWPGPLTLVVPRAAHVPRALTGGGDSVGLRAPSHPVARALLTALGEPIAAPSANRYQTLSPTTAAHVAASLGDRVALILDGGPCAKGIESTVVDLTGAPRIVRPGAIDFPTLATVVPAIVDATPYATEDGNGPHLSPGLDRRHYAPSTRLEITSGRAEAIEAARALSLAGKRAALLLVSPLSPGEAAAAPPVESVALGPGALSYAHALFAALHELDVSRLDVIVVEPVPDTPEWAAVADRLHRAAAR